MGEILVPAAQISQSLTFCHFCFFLRSDVLDAGKPPVAALCWDEPPSGGHLPGVTSRCRLRPGPRLRRAPQTQPPREVLPLPSQAAVGGSCCPDGTQPLGCPPRPPVLRPAFQTRWRRVSPLTGPCPSPERSQRPLSSGASSRGPATSSLLPPSLSCFTVRASHKPDSVSPRVCRCFLFSLPGTRGAPRGPASPTRTRQPHAVLPARGE